MDKLCYTCCSCLRIFILNDCIFEDFCQTCRLSANKTVLSSYADYYRILAWGLSYAKSTRNEMRMLQNLTDDLNVESIAF
jgi:hypothetical protein